jgi:hypothetical protein
MAVITQLHSSCELASRSSCGIEVTLVWNRRSHDLKVCVTDTETGVYFELHAEHDDALDIFHHPYSYAAARGIAYDPAHATAPASEQPSRLAA